VPGGGHSATRPPGRAQLEVARTDRRWLALVAVMFVLVVSLLFGAFAIYRWTGPHVEVTLLLRRLRNMARWFIPRHRQPHKWWW
jgi:hypothetical protein